MTSGRQSPYDQGRAVGRPIGYYGTLGIAFIGLPDLVVWLVAGLVFQAPLALQVALYVIVPGGLYLLWRAYVARRWRRFG